METALVECTDSCLSGRKVSLHNHLTTTLVVGGGAYLVDYARMPPSWKHPGTTLRPNKDRVSALYRDSSNCKNNGTTL